MDPASEAAAGMRADGRPVEPVGSRANERTVAQPIAATHRPGAPNMSGQTGALGGGVRRSRRHCLSLRYPLRCGTAA